MNPYPLSTCQALCFVAWGIFCLIGWFLSCVWLARKRPQAGDLTPLFTPEQKQKAPREISKLLVVMVISAIATWATSYLSYSPIVLVLYFLCVISMGVSGWLAIFYVLGLCLNWLLIKLVGKPPASPPESQ